MQFDKQDAERLKSRTWVREQARAITEVVTERWEEARRDSHELTVLGAELAWQLFETCGIVLSAEVTTQIQLALVAAYLVARAGGGDSSRRAALLRAVSDLDTYGADDMPEVFRDFLRELLGGDSDASGE